MRPRGLCGNPPPALPREARKLGKYTVFESLGMAQMMTSQLSHG